MNRKSVFWVPGPDEDGPNIEWMRCRLADEWYAVDGDRAIVPITKLERSGSSSVNSERRTGLLTQYGGADLILDLVSADLEAGDEFVVVNPADSRPYIDENHEAIDEDD